MKHELFEVGSYDYSDLDDRLNKPVEWTEDDLKLIAKNYRGGIPLTKNTIGSILALEIISAMRTASYSLTFRMNLIWKEKVYLLKLMFY